MNSNNFGPNSALELSKSLIYMPCLQALFLNADFDSVGIGAAGAVSLCEGLRKCTKLVALSLRNQKIGADGAVVRKGPRNPLTTAAGDRGDSLLVHLSYVVGSLKVARLCRVPHLTLARNRIETQDTSDDTLTKVSRMGRAFGA